MGHILHRLFERYLDGQQHAFDTSPRELWPDVKATPFEYEFSLLSVGVQHSAEDGVQRECEPEN